ncbi:MAG: hypothetical protein ABRQ39_06270 [Candidatus Eremiobacterota bacterium]
MSVIEFEANIENGIIKIPEKFVDEIGNNVTVIIKNNKDSAITPEESAQSQRKKFRELPESMLNPVKAGNFKIFTREELHER